MVNMLYLKKRAEISLDSVKVAIYTLRTKNVQDSRKKFENEDLVEALFDEDRCQTRKQLFDTLNVTEIAVDKRLHYLGLVQKAGNWLPHELSERQLKREKRFVNCCLNDS